MRDYQDKDTISRQSDRDDRDMGRRERRSGGAFFGSDDSGRHEREHGRQGRTDEQDGWTDFRGRNRERSQSRGRGRADRFDRERGPEFGSDAYHKGIPMDETRHLISSSKVEGTPVYGRDGDRIGTVQNFMVDKFKGEVVYAVLRSSGGFLGLGQRYYPLDWSELTYQQRVDGYCVDLTAEELEDRRSFDMHGRESSRSDRDDDRDHGRRHRDDGRRDRDRDRW